MTKSEIARALVGLRWAKPDARAPEKLGKPPITCECGECPTCKKREQMRAYRARKKEKAAGLKP